MRRTARKFSEMAQKLGRRPLVLITGGSSGIGACYADYFAADGCDLLLVSNQEEQLNSKAEQLHKLHGITAYACYMDLSDEKAAQTLLEWCDSQKLEVDILVNNAGMFFFNESHPDNLSRGVAMMKLHMLTPTSLMVLFGERMKQRGFGYILIMSSLAAALPLPGISIYSATKSYLKTLGRSMYYEFRPYGVGVTVVCPGAIATPLYGLKPKLLKFGVNIRVIKTPEWLVRRAVKGMLNGRRCMKPGSMNVYAPALVDMVPKPIVTVIWKKFGQ